MMLTSTLQLLHLISLHRRLSVMYLLKLGGKFSCQMFVVHPKFSQDVNPKDGVHQPPSPTPEIENLGFGMKLNIHVLPPAPPK